MPSLKDVKLQIAGVGKTKQITKAMGMVASSKLRGAQGRIERFRPYAEKFGSMLGDLAARTEGAAHPLLQVHDLSLIHISTVLSRLRAEGLVETRGRRFRLHTHPH